MNIIPHPDGDKLSQCYLPNPGNAAAMKQGIAALLQFYVANDTLRVDKANTCTPLYVDQNWARVSLCADESVENATLDVMTTIKLAYELIGNCTYDDGRAGGASRAHVGGPWVGLDFGPPIDGKSWLNMGMNYIGRMW